MKRIVSPPEWSHSFIRKLPAPIQQEDVCAFSAFIHSVSPKAAMYRSKSRVGPERATHEIGVYAEIGMGHVTY